MCAYAFAVAEQNASGGEIVTAPTCGASGVMPAALLYMQEERGFSDEAIVRALAAGGVIGDLIKTNASISGAECGCQAEIGSACSMTAAALGADRAGASSVVDGLRRRKDGTLAGAVDAPEVDALLAAARKKAAPAAAEAEK